MSDTLFDPGPPVCWRCGGKGTVWSERMGMDTGCPECGAQEGMNRTEHAHDASEEWREKAEAVVRSLARRQPYLTSDECVSTFLRLYPDVMTHGDRDERRRWGPLMRRMAKEGVIENTGRFVKSERRRGAAIPVWRSLLWNG